MKTVESTETNVGDEKVGSDLIQFTDRWFEAWRKNDFVTAVSEQRHGGRVIRPHGDNKDLSHAACLLASGFSLYRASDVPLEKPKPSRKTRA
jgi:hypothetical protein